MTATLPSATLTEVHIDFTTRLVTVAGELDVSSCQILADALEQLQRAKDGDIALDLQGVTFIDSSTLGVLVQVRNEQEGISLALHISSASARVQRILALTGLDFVFPCLPAAPVVTLS